MYDLHVYRLHHHTLTMASLPWHPFLGFWSFWPLWRRPSWVTTLWRRPSGRPKWSYSERWGGCVFWGDGRSECSMGTFFVFLFFWDRFFFDRPLLRWWFNILFLFLCIQIIEVVMLRLYSTFMYLVSKPSYTCCKITSTSSHCLAYSIVFLLGVLCFGLSPFPVIVANEGL